jgi:hypothetical protein
MMKAIDRLAEKLGIERFRLIMICVLLVGFAAIVIAKL